MSGSAPSIAAGNHDTPYGPSPDLARKRLNSPSGLPDEPPEGRVVSVEAMLRQLTVLPWAAALGKPPHIKT